MQVKLPIINHIGAVSSLHRDDLPLQQIVFWFLYIETIHIKTIGRWYTA